MWRVGRASEARPGTLLFVVAGLKHVFYRWWRDIRLCRISAVQHVGLRAASDEAGETIEALASEETLGEAGESGHHALAGGLYDDGLCWRG